MAMQGSILIVGAGPSGLMLACELARRGVSFRLIDKKAEPTQSSNAIAIHSRTLEILAQMDLANDFLKAGHRCEALHLYLQGQSLLRLSLESLPSIYPFILTLPQAETERLLLAYLKKRGIAVERSLELVDAEEAASQWTVTLKSAKGSFETLTVDWLMACDGVQSQLRQLAGLNFEGSDIAEQFMVADAQMGSFLPSNELSIFFEKGTVFPDRGMVFAAFPLGAKQYRLAANLYVSHPRKQYTEQEVREVVAERTAGCYNVESVSWISPFWIHDKIVNTLQKKSLFFLGDAAHVHSPAGGQGMNSGMQDAYNIAWKLALVVQGQAKPALLESYQLERYPIVKEIVERTGQLTEMALFNPAFSEILEKMAEQGLKQPELMQAFAEKLTQLDTTYKTSPLIHYSQQPKEAPLLGRRAPDLTGQAQPCLSPYFKHTGHNLLIFTGVEHPFSSLIVERLRAFQGALENAFGDLMKVWVISPEKEAALAPVIVDRQAKLHKLYDVKTEAAYLIRPDGIVSYYAKTLDSAPLVAFLKGYLV